MMPSYRGFDRDYLFGMHDFGRRGFDYLPEKLPRLRKIEGRCEKSKQPRYKCRCKDCNQTYGIIPKGQKDR